MAGFILPTGFDRADGVTVLPIQPQGTGGAGSVIGTPLPDGDLVILGNVGAQGANPEEDPNSPEVERAEQATVLHTLKMSWQNCLNFISLMGRGTFLEDSFGNIWRILSSKIRSLPATMGELSYVAESISFDSPPDEFQIVPVELGINIIKHPRYFPFLNPSTANPVDGTNDYNTQVGVAPNQASVAQVKAAIIRAIQTYVDSPYQPSANTINGLIQNQIVTSLTGGQVPTGQSGTIINTAGSLVCQFALAAAGEIIQKLWKQEDTPYLPGWQITWSQYFFAPVYLNPGAYDENPVGIVPDYFLSPSQNGSNTIFDLFPQINPQDFSSNGQTSGSTQISWLRKADEYEYQRTWFKVSRTWIGSPIGQWDAQIFSENPRVTQPLDTAGVIGFLPLPNG